ncbi:hypothetical protein LSH36_32g06012 [Paralvinella palmiformis]|uniref:Tetraspanin n=1 Tax=Paralvinella palmiformis TaxID=53620 RepID=A0AAD9K975_9ANNE|nr:hypothetical protein LSH36_32g06012 [Paralvinella palmiformis]
MCLKTLATIFLVVLNIAFFIGGAAMLAVGIIAFIDEDLLYKITDVLTDTLSKVIDQVNVITNIDLAGLIKSNAIILLVVGGFLFILGFLGVCGACKKNSTLLKVFEKSIQDGLKLALYKTYKEGLRERDNPGVLSASKHVEEMGMDSLQLDLRCCGVANGTEWQDGGTTWNRTYEITFNSQKINIPDAQYPPSCCILNSTSSKQIGYQTIKVTDFNDLQSCITNGIEVNETPCFDRLKKIIKENEDLVIIIFVVIMAVEQKYQDM